MAVPLTGANPARQCRSLPATWPISPITATASCHTFTGVATGHHPQPHLLASGLARSPTLTYHPSCQRPRLIPSVDSGLDISCVLFLDDSGVGRQPGVVMGHGGCAGLLFGPFLGRDDVDVGRTNGTSSDAAAAISARRGCSLIRWRVSTTTVTSRGSPWAKPAARGPVSATRAGIGGCEVVESLHVAREPRELGFVQDGGCLVELPVRDHD